jgi:pimeloyl-ACP methyl ester carboxylesterase
MGSIETVKSKDGTVIAFERLGHGSPLVMVHGTTVDHTRWGAVVGKLAERFSLFLVDRRGRGLSGDGPLYSVEREFEDVAAVVEATPSAAAVLGHSYGAICALGAARLTPRIAKLVLYEPPLRLPGRAPPLVPDLGRRLEDMLAKNDRVGVIEAFLREVIHMSDRQIARLRRSASWPVHVNAAHTVPREVITASSYQIPAEALASVRAPTMFVLGGQSPAALQEATRSTARALEGSEIAVMPGQGHLAMSTGPGSLLDRVIPFLEGR